jgi:hypothetical protein
MSPVEFQPWPKIARLNRDVVVTEKIDGTNSAIVIQKTEQGFFPAPEDDLRVKSLVAVGDAQYDVYAQSRNRFITPGKATDNAGFAGWVAKNVNSLVELLGEGTHFGEWWGGGIQRGYNLTEKRFSLFNTARWGEVDFGGLVEGLTVVPVLYTGPFVSSIIRDQVELLHKFGSIASPGFPRPEGVVIWHEAARQSFKVTLEGDEAPKRTERSAHDLLPEAVAA